MAKKKNNNNQKKEKVKDYFKKYLKKGYRKEALTDYLVEKGFPADLVRESMRDAERESRVSVPIHEKFTFRPTKQTLTIFLAAAVFVFALLAIFVIYPSVSAADCGFDKSCFAERADNCKASVVKEDLYGSTILYESSKDCVLTKTIEELDISEPFEVKLLFEGKEMECPYSKEQYNPDWSADLVGGIDNCEGELKEAIYNLRIAQIALGT